MAEASREDLYEEVHASLKEHLEGNVDRFGVWLAPRGEDGQAYDHRKFEGRFWDADGGESPQEWKILGNLGELPEGVVANLEPVEVEVASRRLDLPLAASGMRRLLWVPVRLDEQLLGVLFAATRKPAEALPQEPMGRAAAEVAVALGFQIQSLAIRSALAEQALERKILAEVAKEFSLDRVLQEIANGALTCGSSRKPIGPFVMIGLLPRPTKEKMEPDVTPDFRWAAGDRLWARSPTSDLIAPVWQEALTTGRTTGHPMWAPWSQQMTRVLAIPLRSGGDAAGVLLAGLQSSAATLATLERLESRARLASLALELSNRRTPSAGGLESARFFVDHAAAPWFLVNKKLEITHASEPGSRLLSLTPARSDSQPVRSMGTAAQLFRPTEWQRLAGWMTDLARNSPRGASHSIDTELRTGRHVRLQAASLVEGNLALIVQQSGEAMRAGESRAATELTSLIEWLDHGILIFNDQDTLRMANLRFAQLFGLSAEEMEGAHSLREVIDRIAPHVSETDHFAERWWNTARGEDSSLQEEIHVLHPAPRLLERVSRAILDSAGSRIGRLEIYRDITHTQLLQTKLRRNERLVSLGEKVSGIAHELSNPLTTILGYAQRLLARSENSSRRDDMQRIFSEAERASSILRQLLGSPNESVAQLQPVHLNSLIQRTADLHRFQLASEKIRIDLDLEPALPPILGDEGQMQQILMNLMANSRHALLETQRARVISFRTSLGEAGRILLEVSDSGPGIPEALRHRIFDPFFTTKPAGVGTGLGLSIVAGLVRQHGGHIRLNHRTSQGASFALDFPPAAAGPQLLTRVTSPAHSVVGPPAGGGRVLVVEDETTVAQLIADMLSDLGYASDIQQDARRALVAALNHDYELVVCDMKMPGLDGQHFFRALAEAGSPLISRFLFVTGDVLASSTQEFLKDHRLPYVAKPFRVEEFTEKVALILAEPATASSATSPDGLSRKNLSHG